MREGWTGGGWRRWAAILLPIVLAARAILLVFQISSDDRERENAKQPPAWPPVPGEVLRFRGGDPGLAAWAGDAGHRPLVVAVTEKDFETQPSDTACLLDPGVMGRRGGRLTLEERTAGGGWRAAWDGHRTTRTRDEVDEPEDDPQLRAVEAALLDGASCGSTATLELSEDEVHALVELLSGRQPAGDVPPPRAGLNIRAVTPGG